MNIINAESPMGSDGSLRNINPIKNPNPNPNSDNPNLRRTTPRRPEGSVYDARKFLENLRLQKEGNKKISSFANISYYGVRPQILGRFMGNTIKNEPIYKSKMMGIAVSNLNLSKSIEQSSRMSLQTLADIKKHFNSSNSVQEKIINKQTRKLERVLKSQSDSQRDKAIVFDDPNYKQNLIQTKSLEDILRVQEKEHTKSTSGNVSGLIGSILPLVGGILPAVMGQLGLILGGAGFIALLPFLGKVIDWVMNETPIGNVLKKLAHQALDKVTAPKNYDPRMPSRDPEASKLMHNWITWPVGAYKMTKHSATKTLFGKDAPLPPMNPEQHEKAVDSLKKSIMSPWTPVELKVFNSMRYLLDKRKKYDYKKEFEKYEQRYAKFIKKHPSKVDEQRHAEYEQWFKEYYDRPVSSIDSLPPGLISGPNVQTIQDVAKAAGVSPTALYRAIYLESAKTFDPMATNPVNGARGLIQFTNKTSKDMFGMNADELVKKYPTFDSQMRGPVLQYLMNRKKEYGKLDTDEKLWLSIFNPESIRNPNAQLSDLAKKQNNYRFNTGQDYADWVRKNSPEINSLDEATAILEKSSAKTDTLIEQNAILIEQNKTINETLKEQNRIMKNQPAPAQPKNVITTSKTR